MITKNDPEQYEILILMRQNQNNSGMIFLGVKQDINDILWFKQYLNEIKSLSFV